MAINTRKALEFIQRLRHNFLNSGDSDAIVAFAFEFTDDEEIIVDPVAVMALASLGGVLSGLPSDELLSDERLAAANEVLSFAELLVVRREMLGKVYDLRRKHDGAILPDGNIVQRCPTCGQGALIYDGEIPDAESSHPHAVHIFRFETLVGFRVIKACCLEATQ